MVSDEKRAEYEAQLKANGKPILDTDEYFQVTILVRRDLEMTGGKLAAQTFQAGIHARQFMSERDVQLWHDSGMRTICVRVDSLEELLKYRDEAKYSGFSVFTMMDEGLTQVGNHTITCAAVGPLPREDAHRLFGALKLYR